MASLRSLALLAATTFGSLAQAATVDFEDYDHASEDGK